MCYNEKEVKSVTLFVVSDVHGHYSALHKALTEAGFDRDNKEHMFLSCGDLFDRGNENLQVYEYVRSLPRKILLKGNHEDILSKVLIEGYINENANRNGTCITVSQLLGPQSANAMGRLDKIAYREEIKELLDFLDSMEDFYETPKYIFTHGWVPILLDGRMPVINPCWRQTDAEGWRHARWLEWQQLYAVDAVLKAKTIVCGHRPAWLGYKFDSTREPDCNAPFYGDGVIAIDANTVRSGTVNVLVVDV